MPGAPSTVCRWELNTVSSDSAPADSVHPPHPRPPLPANKEGQLYSAVRLRQYNLCLWIMDIPSKWRPIYVLYHASLHLFWLGLWLNSVPFCWWWISWFICSSQARHSIKALCQDRHAECTVTCCLWLTDCAPASQRPPVLPRCDYFQAWGSKTVCVIQHRAATNRTSSVCFRAPTDFFFFFFFFLSVNQNYSNCKLGYNPIHSSVLRLHFITS